MLVYRHARARLALGLGPICTIGEPTLILAPAHVISYTPEFLRAGVAAPLVKARMREQTASVILPAEEALSVCMVSPCNRFRAPCSIHD